MLEAQKEEEWAGNLFDHFSALVDTASREWVEDVTAKSDLQKIKYLLREDAQVLSNVLVDFRRLIRVVRGPTSKEYHSIKSFYGRNSEDFDEQEEPIEPSSDDDQDGTSGEMRPVDPAGALDRAEPNQSAPGTQPVDEGLLNEPIKSGDKFSVA